MSAQFRVKARLTTVAIDRSAADAEDTRELDWTMRCLQRLFPDDPAVGFDDRGWYVAGSALDDADEAGRLRDEAASLISSLNGVSRLLVTDEQVLVAHLTQTYDGETQRPVKVRIYSVRGSSPTVEALDEQAASELLQAAAADRYVRRALECLAGLDGLHGSSFWIDAYRVWDLARGELTKKAYPKHVDGMSERMAYRRREFEETANNPYWGRDRRHEGRYEPRKHPDGSPIELMSREDALAFLRLLVFDWLEREHGLRLQAQA